jgi:hypothetical protein
MMTHITGWISLRFIVKADSLPEVERIVSSLPIWPLAETRITPLVAISERRQERSPARQARRAIR